MCKLIELGMHFCFEFLIRLDLRLIRKTKSRLRHFRGNRRKIQSNVEAVCKATMVLEQLRCVRPLPHWVMSLLMVSRWVSPNPGVHDFYCQFEMHLKTSRCFPWPIPIDKVLVYTIGGVRSVGALWTDQSGGAIIICTRSLNFDHVEYHSIASWWQFSLDQRDSIQGRAHAT